MLSRNLISVENLFKSYADKIICNDVSFGIHESDKIGFIGINGSGKSTLLRMLVGKEMPDSGKITFRSRTSMSYLPQLPELNLELSVYEQVYFSDKKEFQLLRHYFNLIKQMEICPSPELQQEHQRLLRKMDACNAWEIENKAKMYLTKLGLPNIDVPTRQLSGGQKRRLDLARILMDNPDILILDEPTNHLDIETIEWFQDFLTSYQGTVIFVTHDRYFLDAVSNKIMEIEQGQIKFYEGSYSNYLKRKELEYTDLQRKETRRINQLRKEMKWLHRGAQARTSKPKNHLERVKELIDKSYLTTSSEMEISLPSKRMGRTILELQNISKSYGEKDLFTNFSHIFQKLERIGIIGPNGCGKTTLLKIITGEISPDNGRIKTGLNTYFSYFQQETEELDAELTVLDYIRQDADNIRAADDRLYSAVEMLERFLFSGKMQQSKVKSLSGGEQKRLYLLKSLLFGSNFIILDEPTNDLDIRTLEILEDYLDAFKGCILVVSHDRYLLDRLVDYMFVFEQKGIIKFPGNYSDYLLVKKFHKEKNEEYRKETTSSVRIKPLLRSQRLSYHEQREIVELEKAIGEMEKRKLELELYLEKEASKLKPSEFKEISDHLEEMATSLDRFTSRWLELTDKNRL